jgi:hypothetical protein
MSGSGLKHSVFSAGDEMRSEVHLPGYPIQALVSIKI